MLIGELSKKTGFSKDTIRFYEKKGFFALNKKERRENNYKEYPEAVLNRLLTIKRVKKFGFTLEEIKDFIEFIDDGTATCDNVTLTMHRKISDIEEKIKGLQDMKILLVNALNNCNTNEGNCELLTKD